MKNFIYTLTILAGLIFQPETKAQEYNYFVNLTNVESDMIQVSLKTPNINADSIKFCFPAIIPGHHFLVNYGRFIEDFKAFDSKGNTIAVSQSGINEFLIDKADDLSLITYFVNDTDDSDVEDKVMGWSATNFIKDELFIINAGGVFGFLENMESLPVKLEIIKPTGLYGSTALKNVESSGNAQVYKAKNYHQLVDSPIMFAHPDTASIVVGNSRIEVACYCTSGDGIAEYIAGLLKPGMEAVLSFAGGKLPVDKYVFLYYLEDYSKESDLFYNETITFEKIKESIIDKHGVPVLGALEHSNSSFHSLVYVGKNRLTDELLISSAVHEFLHIYTPLNLRSDVRANFNYMEPLMSKHLWLYEGVTEYFSDLVLLKGGLLDINKYLNSVLRFKILTSNAYPGDMIFTEMSERIFDEPFKEQFIQVYNRGSVMAMLLDIEIMRLTGGNKDLRSVFFSLINKYGEDKPFDEEGIFNEISEAVNPELERFFDKYIDGTDSLDYVTAFDAIGLDFVKSANTKVPESILVKGFGVIDAIEFFGAYTINEVTEDSPFRQGDKILSSDFGYNCLFPFLKEDGSFIEEGTSVELPVYRENRWINLEITPSFKKDIYKYQIKIRKNPSRKERLMLNKLTSN